MLTRMPKKRATEKPTHPLAQWRACRGLKQSDVAVASGVSQGMISKIEGYQRIPLGDTLEALLAYTGLATDAFIRPERFLAEHPDFLIKCSLHQPEPPTSL
jgi:transcriptional regulator with XRE-family HTH domain